MRMVPPSVRIYVCTQPTDMRRSFDGLSRMVQDVVGQDPFSGHLFVFWNRRSDRTKILWWDRSGFCLWYKRLEEGAFRFPESAERTYELEAGELALILEGISLAGAQRQPRWKPPAR